jgi:hypothetical protein
MEEHDDDTDNGPGTLGRRRLYGAAAISRMIGG